MSKLVENICQGTHYGGAITMTCPVDIGIEKWEKDIDIEKWEKYVAKHIDIEKWEKYVAKHYTSEGGPIDMFKCRGPKTCGECPHYQGFSMTCNRNDKLKLLESKSTCKCTE